MTEGLKPVQLEKGQRAALLVALTLVCLVMVPLGAVGALFSPLVFDHRPNLLNPVAWAVFLLLIGFWIACILGPFAAWVTWSRGQETHAWIFITIPGVWLIAILVALQFVPG